MRTLILAICTAAGIAAMAAPAHASYCDELRLACEHKGSLGEQGGGNCRTYRATCQRRPSCRQLRYYCLHKEEYGAQGQGFCRSYRESCR